MTRRLNVLPLGAAVFTTFVAVSAAAQLAPQAEDARLRAAAEHAAANPLWAMLQQDNFGQSVWNALAVPAVAGRLAVDPHYNHYGPKDPAGSSSTAAVSARSLVDALMPPSAQLPAVAGETVQNATPIAGEGVTMAARDLGNGISENRYYMMLMTQTYDGVFERSHSQKAGFARLSNANESWVKINYGNGAMVIREPARLGTRATLSADMFASTSPTEVALAYDYRTNSLRGNPRTAAYHNTYVRPLMTGMPALGSNVSWKVSLSAAKLGITRARSDEFPMEVKRTYITHAGTRYVVIEYTVPEFAYGNALGEKVVHRARGVALADTSMGQIFWNTSLQTATTAEASGRQRPYRYARTGYAMDASGQPLVDLDAIPEMKAYLEEFYAPATTQALPIVGSAVPDQTPLEMATRIDLAGFTLGENSANQLGEMIGANANGETGARQGAEIDYLINNVIIPGLSVIGGAVGVRDRNESAAFARKQEELRKAFNVLGRQVDALQNAVTETRAAVSSTSRQLVVAQVKIANLTNQFNAEMKAATTAAEMFGTAGPTMDALLAAKVEAQALMTQLRTATLAHTQALLNVDKVRRFIPTLEAFRESRLIATTAQIGDFLAKSKALTSALNGLSFVANLGGISKNMNLLASFDPHQAGELSLNGTYEGWMGVVEPLLNLAAIAGDFESGNMKAVLLDIASFAGGRIGDIYMSFEAAKAARLEAQMAFFQEVQTALRSAEQSRNHIQQFLKVADNLGGRIEALNRELDNRRDNPARDPNWTDPRFDANGRPIREYWAWLKENSPDTLRRMGIDPEAPVGGWPNGVRPQDRPATEVARQPRLPDGPGYPTRDPSTVQRRTPQATETGTTDPSGVSAMDEMAAATATRRLNNYIPPPRPPARNDHIGTDEQPTVLRFSGVEFDPVTFTPPTWTPPTWDPPTWEPVTWEPPTWEPPTWTPPEFDAPEASEIAWTDLEVGNRWPRSLDNMAFQYGDLSGRVATDLSPWDEWLRTQNVYYLEQLARTAGYPNLASALTDWASLIRKANDPRFYEWAWSPPAVSGAIGIGFSEGQHEMGRAAYLLGDLMKRSGLFGEPDDSRVASGEGGFDDSKQSLRSSNGFGPRGSGAELANNAYGSNFDVQSDRSGFWGRETGGYLAANLFAYDDPYLRQLMNNGRTGLDRLLAQPFNVVLTWGDNAYDLDLHMTGPLGEGVTDRFHIYFAASGNLEAQPYAALIKDCVCNSGSEVILTSALNRGGVYRVSVFNYGDQSASSSNLSSASSARIQIVRGGTTQSVGNGTTIIGGHTILDTTVPGGGVGNTWTAVELDPRNGRITVPRTISQSSGSGGVH